MIAIARGDLADSSDDEMVSLAFIVCNELTGYSIWNPIKLNEYCSIL